MNYHSDIVNIWGGGGRLLERGAHSENLTFWRGAYKRVSAHQIIYGSFKQQVSSSMEFDNDCNVIFMSKM